MKEDLSVNELAALLKWLSGKNTRPVRVFIETKDCRTQTCSVESVKDYDDMLVLHVKTDFETYKND